MPRPLRTLCLLVFCCLCACAFAAAQEPRPNLLSNPDFELGHDVDGVPLYWEVFSRSDTAGFTLTTEKASSGETALLVFDTVNDRSAGLRSARVPAEPGRTYRVEVDVWVEAGLAQIYLDFHGASGARIEAKIERARVSADWQTVAAEAVAPEGTTHVSVILYSDIVNVGKVYFDNVRLFDMTAEPEKERTQSSDAAGAPRTYAVPGTRMAPDQYIAPFDVTVAEWETKPPALYPPLPVREGPDVVVTGPLRVEFTAEGLPASIAFDRTRQSRAESALPLATDLKITVASSRPGAGAETEKLVFVPGASGYEVNNSYFTRRLARFARPGSTERRLDVYTELITESFWAYIFPRLYLRPGETTDLTTAFRLPGAVRRLTYFEGDARRQSDLTAPVTLQLDAGVTKPFLLFERSGGEPGIAFFLPVRPEVRAWYHEHYVAVDVPVVQVDIVPDAEGVTVTFRAEGLRATSERPHTFDFYYWAFPVTVSADLSLHAVGGIAPRIWSNIPVFADEGVAGFWASHMPNTGNARPYQALRYYPEEGYSFAHPDYFYKGLFTTMPEGAHVWGNQTANYKRLNFTGSVHSSGLMYDLAVRHLQLYLDKADDVGIPPFKATAAVWFEHFAGLSDYGLLQNFHFAQTPEYMVRTALNFVQTGRPSPEDARAIADVVNRTLTLLDPESPGRIPNTFVLPDGSYWYNYFEMETQRVREGLQDEPGFVNNVHVTWLNVIVDAARLNQLVGNEDAYAAWCRYLMKGIDGMIYIFSQDRAWAADDPNELLYGINWPGPNANYAQYLLSGWLPHVMEFVYEELDGYRMAEMVALYRKIMAGRWTAQPQYAAARSAAVTWLNTYLHPKDRTAPVTTVLQDGSEVTSGTIVAAESPIALFARDDLSGVARTEYSLNGRDWTVYDGPFTLPAGDVVLAVRSTDHAGNTETEQRLDLRAR